MAPRLGTVICDTCGTLLRLTREQVRSAKNRSPRGTGVIQIQPDAPYATDWNDGGNFSITGDRLCYLDAMGFWWCAACLDGAMTELLDVRTRRTRDDALRNAPVVVTDGDRVATRIAAHSRRRS